MCEKQLVFLYQKIIIFSVLQHKMFHFHGPSLYYFRHNLRFTAIHVPLGAAHQLREDPLHWLIVVDPQAHHFRPLFDRLKGLGIRFDYEDGH